MNEHPIHIALRDPYYMTAEEMAAHRLARALLDAGKLAERVECPDCHGSGESDCMEANEIADCSECHGDGFVWEVIRSIRFTTMKDEKEFEA